MKMIFVSKAEENIKAAELLFEKQMYNASANRAYYAAFHAAIAALANIGIPVERISHDTLQSKFSSELIQKRKVYSGSFKSYLSTLQVIRNTADYEAKFISKKIAERQLKKAKEYIIAINKEIEK